MARSDRTAAAFTLLPGGQMKRAFWSVLALCTVAACAHLINPRVMPRKIPPVSPPIRARALLLITPSFEEYLSEGEEHRTRYGVAAAKALSALVTESFTATEIRRLADVEVPSLLTGTTDTSGADLLLVPSFESASAPRGRLTQVDSYYVAQEYVAG